jgi:Single-strand binding protein family
MSARAIVSGAIGKAAEFRTSKSGNLFATFSIRESVNGATRWWQAITFSETVIETLKEMAVGEPIAVCGEMTAEIYAPAGAESRINWRITIDCVLSARKPKVKSAEAPRKPRAAKGRDRAEASLARQAEAPNTGGRALAAASWASPARAEVETPRRAEKGADFDDSIPF